MAGGNYLTYNKKLPGAYINFQSVPNAAGTLGERGIATMPLPLEWGPNHTVIELLSTDLEDGNSLSKVGTTAFYEDSLILRECLKHCYKLLVWRMDTGAAKASATLGNLTATAKYGGQKGNLLQVAVVENEGDSAAFDVVTFFKQTEKDRQTVKDIQALTSNEWITFGGEGALVAAAGTFLAGGTSGEVKDEEYSNYLAAMRKVTWNTMGIPVDNAKLIPVITSYIKNLRDKAGKKVQAVVYNNTTADHEGIISCKQGYTTETEIIDPVTFVAWVTGATAGADVNESLCYKILTGATGIIGELTEDELETEITKGWFLLGRRVDGVIVVLDDLNTLISVTPEKDADFGNNRVIRVFDEIAMTTRLQFEQSYIGKVDNIPGGRDIFRAQLNANFEVLQNIRAIQNHHIDDLEVLPGPGKSDVVVNAYIQPVDSMKKLYMNVFES